MAKAPISVEDLKAMDTAELELEIKELEGNLTLHVAKAQAEIDGRKSLLKVISVLKNGKPPRKKRKDAGASKPPEASQQPAAPAFVPASQRGRPSNADRIAQVLALRGKLNQSEIAKQVGLTDESAKFALDNDDRFERDAVGLWQMA